MPDNKRDYVLGAIRIWAVRQARDAIDQLSSGGMSRLAAKILVEHELNSAAGIVREKWLDSDGAEAHEGLPSKREQA